MACEPNDLIQAARCMSCLSLPQLLQVQTYLLCLLVGSGGTTGTAAIIYTGTGDPTGVLTPTQSIALYIDTNTGVLYQWYSNAWH